MQEKRGRKRHTSSRRGCSNCKLRHVKVWYLHRAIRDVLIILQCDEVEPACSKCRNSGLRCTYGSNVRELSSSYENELSQAIPVFSTTQTVLAHLNRAIVSHSDSRSSMSELFQLNGQDLERLSRFQDRTLISSGLMNAEVFRKESLRLMTTVSWLSRHQDQT